MAYILDDRIPEKEVIISENKSGARTVNDKSAKQLLYNYRRKYGEEEYQKLLKEADEMPGEDDSEEKVDTSK